MARPAEIADEGLRAQLTRANELLSEGRATDVVHKCVEAYLRLLDLHPELLDARIELRPGHDIPAVMRWPALGANLAQESVIAGEPSIHYQRQEFTISEAITYYEFTLEAVLSAEEHD